MAFHRSLSAFLLPILFAQTIFLGSGLLGVCAEDASKICSCNHGSKLEKHANAEDKLFKKQKKMGTLLLATKEDHESAELNCHTAAHGEVHICSCKKKKSSLARLSIYHQVWHPSAHTHVFIPHLFEETSTPKFTDMTRDGWDLLLIKPPKFS